MWAGAPRKLSVAGLLRTAEPQLQRGQSSQRSQHTQRSVVDRHTQTATHSKTTAVGCQTDDGMDSYAGGADITDAANLQPKRSRRDIDIGGETDPVTYVPMTSDFPAEQDMKVGARCQQP